MEDAILECGGADLGVVRRQQAGELAQERSMIVGRTSLETSPAPRSKTLQGRTACRTTPLVLATWSECSQETNKRFLSPRRDHQQHVGEAAHEHITEQVRDLGERLPHEGDFSYEDITGQDMNFQWTAHLHQQ